MFYLCFFDSFSNFFFYLFYTLIFLILSSFPDFLKALRVLFIQSYFLLIKASFLRWFFTLFSNFFMPSHFLVFLTLICVLSYFVSYSNVFQVVKQNFLLFPEHVFLNCFHCLWRCYSCYSLFLNLILVFDLAFFLLIGKKQIY